MVSRQMRIGVISPWRQRRRGRRLPRHDRRSWRRGRKTGKSSGRFRRQLRRRRAMYGQHDHGLHRVGLGRGGRGERGRRKTGRRKLEDRWRQRGVVVVRVPVSADPGQRVGVIFSRQVFGFDAWRFEIQVFPLGFDFLLGKNKKIFV
jgi:hypothetical protein